MWKENWDVISNMQAAQLEDADRVLLDKVQERLLQ
jgi:hypothetical protein